MADIYNDSDFINFTEQNLHLYSLTHYMLMLL